MLLKELLKVYYWNTDEKRGKIMTATYAITKLFVLHANAII